MSKKIAIGFDLGTTSVGWSIIKYNENNPRKCELVDRGVRLFDQLQSENQERRMARSQRRRILRKNYRQYKLMKFLIDQKICEHEGEFKNFICKQPNDMMPFEIKIKALEQGISNHELTYLLNSYVKKRGTFIEENYSEKYQNLLNERRIIEIEILSLKEEVKTKNEKELNDLNKKLSKIDKDLKEEKLNVVNDYDSQILPCQNQQNWWNKYGKVNLNKNLNFKVEDYQKELEIILKKQNLLHYKDDLKKIIWNKREYWEGPGSENSFSIWGRYDENGTKKYEKLWEKNIGVCSWFSKEKRTFKNSPKYILFNLINKLSILNFEYKTKRYYLSKKQIREFILYFIKPENIKKEVKVGNIFKWLIKENKIFDVFNDVDEKLLNDKNKEKWLNDLMVFGFNNKKEKQPKEMLIIDIKNFLIIFKYFTKTNQWQSINQENIEILNKIYIKIATNSNYDDLKEIMLSDFNINDQIDKSFWEKESKEMQPGSLSEKAINMYIDFFFKKINDDKKMQDQQTFYIENIIKTNLISCNDFEGKKYFPNNHFKDEIMPPNVKRIFQQATNVFNSILKKYVYKNKFELDFITIELAREINSADEKKKFSKLNDENEKFLDNFKEKYPNEFAKIESAKITNKFLKKLKLWCEQDGKDVYQLNTQNDGLQKINIEELDLCQIDHIFPNSKTHDSRFENLVLTKIENNQEKENKTPYEYLPKDKFDYFNKLWKKLYENNILRLEISRKRQKKSKLDKLCFLGSSNEISSHFFTNALNDTRYATSEFLNQLKIFASCSYNGLLKKTRIQSINGIITNSFKYNSFNEKLKESNLLIKDRQKNEHHSIDALICTVIGKEKWAHDFENQKYKTSEFNLRTGEKINNTINNKFIKKYYENLFEKNILKKINCKYSRMKIEKCNNQKLFNIEKKSIQEQFIKDGKKAWYKIEKEILLNMNLNDYSKKVNEILLDKSMKDYIEKYIINKFSTFQEYCKDNEIKQRCKDILKLDVNPENEKFWNDFFKIKGVPIFKFDTFNNKIKNIKIINFIKHIRIRNKKPIEDKNLSKLFILDKDIKSKKVNNVKLSKKTIYDNKYWKNIIVFLNKNNYVILYITANYFTWDNDKNKMAIDILKIKRWSKENGVDCSSFTCDEHKNIENNTHKIICSICEKMLLKNNDNKLVISRGMCFYLPKISKNISKDDVNVKKIDWDAVYYVSGGSEQKENIEIKKITGIDYSDAFKNKLNEQKLKIDDENNEQKTKAIFQYKKLLNNPEFKREILSIKSFLEKCTCILDIDTLGDYQINYSIFKK